MIVLCAAEIVMSLQLQQTPMNGKYVHREILDEFFVFKADEPIRGLMKATIHGCTTRNLSDKANDKYAPRYGGSRTAFKTGLSPCFEVIK